MSVDTSAEAVEALAFDLDNVPPCANNCGCAPACRVRSPDCCMCSEVAATLRALAAERDALRAVIEAAAVWHVEQAKALSKQPQSGEVPWRRLLHREQINNLRAALTGATP